ncbi:MFS transporter [Zhaonella formicivorans]|uniref:MFS transporter n=1 Tax=Zhaonella formicivorans TaxID=2528593 RepID=UPI002688A9AF
MQTAPNFEENKTYIFYLVMALIFADTVLYGTIVPLIPVYTEELGLTTLTIGIIFAAYSLGLLLFSMPMGILAERLGYKKVFAGGLSFLILSCLLYGTVNNGLFLAFCRFIQGVAAATTWTAGLAMIALLYPRQQGQKLGLVLAAMGVGTILGPPVGGLLYKYLGYRLMFFALALVFAAMLTVVWKLDFSFPGMVKAEAGQRSRKKLALPSNLLWLCVVVVFASSSFGMLEIIMPNYMHRHFGLDSLQIGLLFGLMGIVHGVSDAAVGLWSDRLGYSLFVYWGLLTAAAFFPLLALAPNLLLLSIAFTLLGVAIGAAITPSQPLMYEVVVAEPSRLENGGPGLAYGIYNTCFSLGMFFGPMLGGLLDRYLGLLPGLLVFSGLFVAAAFLIKFKVNKISGKTA